MATKPHPAAQPKSSPPRVTGAAFWALIDRWGIPDDLALAIIDHPPSPSGKRPRFALTTDQAGRLELLHEIDLVAGELLGEAGPWLLKRNPAAPFRKKSPAAVMAKGRGIEATLQHLQQAALVASVKLAGRK